MVCGKGVWRRLSVRERCVCACVCACVCGQEVGCEGKGSIRKACVWACIGLRDGKRGTEDVRRLWWWCCRG